MENRQYRLLQAAYWTLFCVSHGYITYYLTSFDFSPGEIGVFICGDTGYIKEYREDGLHSHNPAFAVRTPDELGGVICLGHVLGAVDERTAPTEHQAALLDDVLSAGARPRLYSL